MNHDPLVKDFIRSRREKDFRLLYRQYTPALYGFALNLSKDKGLAEEVVQITWLRGIEGIERFDQKSSFKTWMTGILINVIRETRRFASKLTIEEISESRNGRTHFSTDIKIDMEWALSCLPIGYRQVILLHDVEGYKHKEIAQLLNINEGTSKSQLFQARKKIRKILTDNEGK